MWKINLCFNNFVWVMFICFLPLNSLFAAPLQAKKTKTTIGMTQLVSKGDYGLNVETKLNASVFKITHKTQLFNLSVSLPYLNITGPGTEVYEDIVTGDFYTFNINDAKRTGFADTVVSADYTIFQNRNEGEKIRLGIAIKLPSGDEEEGLSKGEKDWSFFVKGQKHVGQSIYSTQAGYQLVGDTDATNFNNRFFATANVFYVVNKYWGLGSGVRYKQASLDTRDDQFSISAFVSYKSTEPWGISFRISKGLTDAVANTSLGVQFSYTLPSSP